MFITVFAIKSGIKKGNPPSNITALSFSKDFKSPITELTFCEHASGYMGKIELKSADGQSFSYGNASSKCRKRSIPKNDCLTTYGNVFYKSQLLVVELKTKNGTKHVLGELVANTTFTDMKKCMTGAEGIFDKSGTFVGLGWIASDVVVKKKVVANKKSRKVVNQNGKKSSVKPKLPKKSDDSSSTIVGIVVGLLGLAILIIAGVCLYEIYYPDESDKVSKNT